MLPKIFRLFMLAIVMSVSSVTTHAALSATDLDRVGFNKLSEQQKAAIMKHVTDTVSTDAASSSTVTADNLDKWANFGEKLGKSLSGTAKELGVAVNDFVKTPVGMLATGIIVWHFLGGVAVHLIGFTFITLFALCAILYVNKVGVETVIEYDKESPVNIFGNYRKARVRKTRPDDAISFSITIFAVATVINLIILFTI